MFPRDEIDWEIKSIWIPLAEASLLYYIFCVDIKAVMPKHKHIHVIYEIVFEFGDNVKSYASECMMISLVLNFLN